VGALASQFGASVDVLHVIDTREGGLGLSGAFLDDDPQAMSGRSPDEGYIGRHGDGPDPEEVEAGLTDHAEALIQASTGEVDLTTAVESGTPHSVILRYADEADADLVVMGTHGRTGVERYLLGSVAEKVVRLSDVPVMTVRADEDE
jgi:nucleotide-binding universal stress UspA family protein